MARRPTVPAPTRRARPEEPPPPVALPCASCGVVSVGPCEECALAATSPNADPPRVDTVQTAIGASPLWRGATLRPLADLVPHPRNYRRHPPDQVLHLAQSVREQGCYRPLVVARGGVLLAGHGLLLALGSLGATHGPVLELDLDPLEPRALKLLAADNELGHLAEIDDRALSELLKEVKDQDLTGLLGTGYDAAMLANLVLVTRPASEIGTLNEAAEWVGMPAYDEGGDVPLKLVVAFKTEADRAEFVKRFEITVDKRAGGTWSTRWPFTTRVDAASVGFREPGRATPAAAPARPVHAVGCDMDESCTCGAAGTGSVPA